MPCASKDPCSKTKIRLASLTLLTFCEMIISDNLSKGNAFDNISKMFEMEESYCEVWWQYVKENEDKLWRIIKLWSVKWKFCCN